MSSPPDSVADEELPAATAEPPRDIKPIGQDTVHRICSGQVVLSLGIAVKELVENAIDAGATLVEVRLREQGIEQIDVIDNGSGVDEANFEGLTAKYHTSKIREFADLEAVATFGFRGEALSSLCALANTTITTRHTSAAIATKLELDHNGGIAKRSACARQTGTTVTLTNLFGTLPVRKREFVKNVKKEFTRMCQILQGYCLVARGVRIVCSNQTLKGAKTTVMATAGSDSYLENVTAIFGAKQKADLMELRTTEEEEAANGFRVEGWISSCAHGCGRSTRDRQFVYVNARPCEPKQVIKVINEVYHRYNVHQSPFVLLNIVVDRNQVDVNLTPDKRQLLVNNEQQLLEVVKGVLLRTFGDVPSTFRMQNLDVSTKPNVSRGDASIVEVADKDIDNDVDCVPNNSKFSEMLTQWKRTGQTDEPLPKSQPKRKTGVSEIAVRNVRMRTMQEYLSQSPVTNSPNIDESVDLSGSSEVIESSQDLFGDKTIEHINTEPERCFRINATPSNKNRFTKISVDSPMFKPERSKSPSPISPPASQTSNTPPTKPTNRTPMSPIPYVLDDDSDNDSDTDTVQLSFKSQTTTDISDEIVVSVDRIRSLMLAETVAKQQHQQRRASLERLRFKATIDPRKNNAAEQELRTEITKRDFARMDIIGQFNLGFVVVRLDDDLFIVDQHASDEKYNFETLQRTTRLQHQPLVRPQPLDLTAVNEMVLIDNLSVFEMNGFRFEIDETAEPTRKCKLVGKPFSKNWEFGKEDIDELIFMLHDAHGDLDTCRPSRIRNMFASRACRKSVMVGTPLTIPKMKRLVVQMSEIDHPWNCPHGRPTMRHLLNLAMLDDIVGDKLDASNSNE